jgi:hypothetical protein
MIENVALLGLSCAFNPVLIGVVLLTLASEHPKRMLGAYFAGAFTWSVGLGIGVVTVASDADVFGGHSSSSRPGADIAVGVLLLVGAFLYATGRAARLKARRKTRRDERAQGQRQRSGEGGPEPEQEQENEKEKKPMAERLLSGSAPLAFFAGVVLNFPSVRYIAAMKEIVVAEVSKHEQVLAILLFNVLMLSPAIVPLCALVVHPEGTRSAIARLDAWLRAHARVLLTTIFVVLGVYLIVKGLVALG